MSQKLPTNVPVSVLDNLPNAPPKPTKAEEPIDYEKVQAVRGVSSLVPAINSYALFAKVLHNK